MDRPQRTEVSAYSWHLHIGLVELKSTDRDAWSKTVHNFYGPLRTTRIRREKSGKGLLLQFLLKLCCAYCAIEPGVWPFLVTFGTTTHMM